jgi:hypothetical protein
MRYCIIVVLLCVAQPASAWSEADTRREVGYLTLHAIDWGQTLDIAEQCGHTNYYEHNPVLGKCPSRGDVNTYFALTAIGHYAVSRALPPKWRKRWQYVTIGVQVGAVANNIKIGLEVKF